MKKHLLIISIIVVIVSIFVSCSVNSSSENISTTVVADGDGTTHYYKPVTDDKNTSAYGEIMTDNKSKTVTIKNGTYVPKEHTTVLTTAKESVSKSKNSTVKQSQVTSTSNPDDNAVEFEPDEPTEETKLTTSTTTERLTTKTTTTQKITQPATDKDGWITKWY